MKELTFSIEQVAYLLQLQVKRRWSYQIDVNCPFCLGKDGKRDCHGHMNINFEKNVFRCNRCNAQGGMLDLYAMYYGISRKEAFININEQLEICTPSRIPAKKPCDIVPRMESMEKLPLEEINKTYTELISLLTLSNVHKENLLNKVYYADNLKLKAYDEVLNSIDKILSY